MAAEAFFERPDFDCARDLLHAFLLVAKRYRCSAAYPLLVSTLCSMFSFFKPLYVKSADLFLDHAVIKEAPVVLSAIELQLKRLESEENSVQRVVSTLEVDLGNRPDLSAGTWKALSPGTLAKVMFHTGYHLGDGAKIVEGSMAASAGLQLQDLASLGKPYVECFSASDHASFRTWRSRKASSRT